MIKKIAFLGILASQLSVLALASIPIPPCYPCLVGPAPVASSSVKSIPIPPCYPCIVAPAPVAKSIPIPPCYPCVVTPAPIR
jgi:hypothetical protein